MADRQAEKVNRQRTSADQVRRSKARQQAFQWGSRVALLLLTITLAVSWQAGWLARWHAQGQQSFYNLSQRCGLRFEDLWIEGRVYTPQQEVATVFTTPLGSSIFEVDLSGVYETLSRLPWIESVVLERRFPGTIFVHLQEKEPTAIWQNKGFHLLDAKGDVIAPVIPEEWEHLPLLVGEEANQGMQALLNALNEVPTLKQEVMSATRLGARRWDLKLKNGIVVKLPENDMLLALKKLEQVQGASWAVDSDILVVDLRNQGRLTLKMVSLDRLKKTNGINNDKKEALKQ